MYRNPTKYKTLRVCGQHFLPSYYLPDQKHELAPQLYKPKHQLKPEYAAVCSPSSKSLPTNRIVRGALQKRQAIREEVRKIIIIFPRGKN